jgi:hypothetical protein
VPIISSKGGLSSGGYGQFAYAANLAPTNSYFPIASYTVPSGGQALVSFDVIPQIYTHLQIRMSTKDATGLASQGIRMNKDGSTTTNYDYHRLYGTGAAAAAGGAASTDIALIGISSTHFGTTIVDLLDYRDTNKYKTVRSLSGWDGNGSGWVGLWSALYMNTSAITSVELLTAAGTQNWTQYSTFSLYGVN